uniref:Uncharacterized protein n=1 Tax=Arundo donax TaxID=35708 RepID=A0A0A8ZXJ6_ARUDO
MRKIFVAPPTWDVSQIYSPMSSISSPSPFCLLVDLLIGLQQ